MPMKESEAGVEEPGRGQTRMHDGSLGRRKFQAAVQF